MSSTDRIWSSRMRWRFRGAWQWPTFAVLTVVDGLILAWLPPSGSHIGVGSGFLSDFLAGLILASFGNLVLVGAAAPWLAKRLHRRAAAPAGGNGKPATQLGSLPLEVVRDRTATAALVAATIGLVAAGLGNIKVVVADTKAVEEAGRRATAFIDTHGSAEVKQNTDTLNTHRLSDGYFRVCAALDDRTKAFCMFIDTKKNTVVKDPDARPNGEEFAGPGE
jgi:hypothetical protein